jgi:hypothetical protein
MAKFVHSCLAIVAALITGCITASEDEITTEVESAQATLSADAISRLPRRCFSSSAGQVITLDLRREEITPTPDRIEALGLSSLGLIQDHLVACARPGPEGSVEVLDLATGFTNAIELPCDGVTAVDDKIYVQTLTADLSEYASLRALVANEPTRTLPAPFASRIGAGHGRLLAAWHSDDEVLAVDLRTAATTAIHLPDYDGWIFGLYENARVRLVTGGWVEKGINVYDATSGDPIVRLFPDTWLEGLACTT